VEMTDYKKEYITEQFRKSFNKKYENYCISRIYHLLMRDDIQLITQQIFYRADGKHGMADAYFPQINVWVEIDEGHHEKQKEDDEKRTQQIINTKIKRLEEVISLTTLDRPERIQIYEQSLEQINARIDEIVALINHKIKEQEKNGTFIPWENVYISPDYFIKKGEIKFSDNAQFRTSQMVSELFNKGYKPGSQKAWFNTCIVNTYVWCPKLSLSDGDFDHIDYINKISYDGNVITEYGKKENNAFVLDAINNPLGAEVRYVFPYYRCSDGRNAYKFRGVFKLDIEQTQNNNIRTWVKISDKADLSQFF